VNPRELANSICATLQQHGYQALLVGGCVRDILLNRDPADYDVTTDATPAQVMELFPDSLGVGAQFGVVLVPRDGHKVEVATFRCDVGYSDGRHPDQVVYAHTPQEDVSRRDFTINGLLMKHDTRAVRFAARFGYTIDPDTFAAIRKHASEIHLVSPERIRDELTKLLIEGAARRGFELLDDTGLLRELLPEISLMKGVQQPSEYHPEGDVWIHTRMMLDGLPAGVSPTLAWGVLLHDVGKPPTFRPASETGDRIRFDGHVDVGVRMAEAICRRLRFANEETEQVKALVANHMKFKDVAQMRKSTLKRFVRQPRFAEHLELHRLDCSASHGRLDAYQAVRDFLAATPAEQVRPPKLLNGDDLVGLGFQPGPAFQRILTAVEDSQLDGALQTKEQAIAFVRRNYSKGVNGR
jgi:poly(A) polymerase